MSFGRCCCFRKEKRKEIHAGKVGNELLFVLSLKDLHKEMFGSKLLKIAIKIKL